jgi:hypothetical protein
MPERLTLGQAVDAMIAGKHVLVERLLYRYDPISGCFEQKSSDPEDDFNPTCLDKEEVRAASRGECYLYEPPIKWRKATWLEALQAAYEGRKVKEMSLGHERIITKNDFSHMRVQELESWHDDLYVEDK